MKWHFLASFAGLLTICALPARGGDLLNPDQRFLEIPRLTLDAASAPIFVQLTAIFEEDGSFVKPIHKTDRHYTAGESLTLAFQAPFVERWGLDIPSFWREFNDDVVHQTTALGFTAGQQMFTPEDLSATAAIPDDEPYAGYLYGGVFLQRAHAPLTGLASFEQMELDLGIIGPAAQGRQTQQYVHSKFNYMTPAGWDNQVNDEFGFNAMYIRKWRMDLLPAQATWGLQLIPQAGLTLGTFDRNATAAATVRFGYNLPDDFGPARISDLPSATARQFHDFGVYAFLRGGGRFVEHSTVLQGNNFRDYPLGVDPEPVVGEANAGFALQFFKCIDLGWNWTAETKEFKGQNGNDSYGTLSLSLFGKF